MITTWDSAEQLAVEYMRRLGWAHARLTAAGADGGLDAVAAGVGAQVKFLSKPVGSPDIQRLRGATHTMPHALFFSNSGYTASARDVADATGVALFGYNTDELVYPANGAARELAKRAGMDIKSLTELQLILIRAEELLRIVHAQHKAMVAATKENTLAVQTEAIAVKQRGNLTEESVRRLEKKYADVTTDVNLAQESDRLYESYRGTISARLRENDLMAIVESGESTLEEFDRLAAQLSFGADPLVPLTEKFAEELRSVEAGSNTGTGTSTHMHLDFAEAVRKLRAWQADRDRLALADPALIES
ncbi:restriction endonuclease [Leifsonia sp. NPDC058230]|uniref:restriction endonuclease n=1 Tax=Leifsonia sp. NPDC058230 TaxID=3346391 RepID=UPI0036DF2368